MFSGEVVVSHLLLTRLPEHHFVHGGFAINHSLANIIYFEDVHQGLMAVVMPPPNIETKYARFSGKPLPPRPTTPSVN